MATCNDVPSRVLPDPPLPEEFRKDADLHVVKGTVPVYVYVRDGVVERVVVDDADVTFDLAVHKGDPETYEVLEEEKDPVWIQVAKDAAFNPEGKKPWPGWEWGW